MFVYLEAVDADGGKHFATDWNPGFVQCSNIRHALPALSD
jgi:hypothetical protein